MINRDRSRWSSVTIILLVMLVAFVGAFFGLRYYVFQKVPASVISEMKRYETQVVTLSPEWHEPADVPPAAVLDFHKNFGVSMKHIRETHRLQTIGGRAGLDTIFEDLNDNYSAEEERLRMQAFLRDLQPLIDETSRSVRLEGYTFEPDVLLLGTDVSFLDVRFFIEVLPYAALELARYGDCEGAIETICLGLHFVKRPAQSHLITHLIAVGAVDKTVSSLITVLDACPDPNAVRIALDQINEMQPEVFPGNQEEWIYDHLAALRLATAYGYSFDISPQPRAAYARQWGELHSSDYYEFIKRQFPPTDIRHQAAVRSLLSIKSSSSTDALGKSKLIEDASELSNIAFQFVSGLDPDTLNSVMNQINWGGVFSRTNFQKAKYDLLRIRLATQLARASLAGFDAVTEEDINLLGDAEEQFAEQLKVYLSPVPKDPFSGKHFLFSSHENTFYSVGPDLQDNGTTQMFDPTNGTTSTGDVWLQSN